MDEDTEAALAARLPGRQFFRDYDDSSDEEDLAQKTNAINYEDLYQQAYTTAHVGNYDQRVFWMVHVLANRLLYSREVNQFYYLNAKPQLNEKANISPEEITYLLNEIIKAVIHDISPFLLINEGDRELTEEDYQQLESDVFEEFNLEEMTEAVYHQLNNLTMKNFPALLTAITAIFKEQLATIPFNPLQAEQGDMYCYPLPYPPATFQTDEYFAKRRMGFGSQIDVIALDSIKERIPSHTKCYKNGDANRLNAFTTNLLRVRNYTWNIVGPLNGSRNPQKALAPQEQALIPLYLLDIIDLDNAVAAKNRDARAWKEATKNQYTMWFVDFLILSDDRIQHLIQIYLDKYTSEMVKGFFSANRPTLGNAHTFTSENPVHFLGNLRLANRSIKRELKNIQGNADTRKVYVSESPKTVHFHWNFFKKPFVPALETQSVNASTATRTSIVDSAGSYAEVFTNIQKIQQVLSGAGKPHDDKTIGLLFRALFKGTLTETLESYSRELKNILFERISAIGYLLFGCEVTRNPGTLIIHHMMLDLIISAQDPDVSWKTLLTNDRLMPMADSDSIKRARCLNNYFKNTSGIIFPYSLDASKESLHGTSEDFAALYSAECALIQRWLVLKKINLKSNLNDLARDICHCFGEWFGNNRFDLTQFILPQEPPAPRTRRGTLRQPKK